MRRGCSLTVICPWRKSASPAGSAAWHASMPRSVSLTACRRADTAQCAAAMRARPRAAASALFAQTTCPAVSYRRAMRISRRQEPGPTPLASRAFRRLWLARGPSLAGDAASWVAMAALVLSSAHGSLPLLTVLYTAPVAVGGMAAGWALDRFDRRRLLAADAAVRGVVFAGIPVAAAAGSLGSTQVYATAAGYRLVKMSRLGRLPAVLPPLGGESPPTP